MTFDNPGEGTPFESPIEDGTYAVYCIGTSEGGNYGNGPTIKWEFYVYDRSGQSPFYLDNGDPFVLSVLSSTKLTRSEKGNSKGYDWATALIGGSIDGMTGQQVADAVREKWGVATVVHNQRGFPQIPEGGLKPWSPPAAQAAPAPAAAPAPSPPSAPSPQPAPPAQPAAAPAAVPDSEEELPF